MNHEIDKSMKGDVLCHVNGSERVYNVRARSPSTSASSQLASTPDETIELSSRNEKTLTARVAHHARSRAHVKGFSSLHLPANFQKLLLPRKILSHQSKQKIVFLESRSAKFYNPRKTKLCGKLPTMKMQRLRNSRLLRIPVTTQ